jgi:hypothetical protein
MEGVRRTAKLMVEQSKQMAEDANRMAAEAKIMRHKAVNDLSVHVCKKS